MKLKMAGWMLGMLMLGYALAQGGIGVSAQQAFLPPMFEMGARVVLQSDKETVYTLVRQQGAWVQVVKATGGQDQPETWIYTPSGTVWTRTK
jgi:hypothetical protein